MRVTKKQYPMETRLVAKLDKFIERCTQPKPALDALLIIDGREGYGKTTNAVGIAYYFAEKTGRKFSEAHCFFDLDELINFAITTKEQIIIWDEAALAGLAAEWQKKIQIKLTKLLMTVRKKRHFFIFNIPKAEKLNEYLYDRAVGLVHVYARDDVIVGRFTYYNYQAKTVMYNHFRKTRMMNYKKRVSFRGTFPDVLDPKNEYNVLDTFNAEKYDENKDKAIRSIGDEDGDKMSRYKRSFLRAQYALALLSFHMTQQYGVSYNKIEVICGVGHKELKKGLEIIEEYPEILGDGDGVARDTLREGGKKHMEAEPLINE